MSWSCSRGCWYLEQTMLLKLCFRSKGATALAMAFQYPQSSYQIGECRTQPLMFPLNRNLPVTYIASWKSSRKIDSSLSTKYHQNLLNLWDLIYGQYLFSMGRHLRKKKNCKNRPILSTDHLFEYSVSIYALPHILLLLKYTSSNNISAVL